MISNMLRFSPSLFAELEGILSSELPGYSRNPAVNYPQVNMGVTDKSVEIYLFVPGMEASSLDVSLEKNLLSISAERAPEETDNKDALSRYERFSGKFKRVITLPDDVDPEQTDATYRDGILHISVAKKEETLPRKIEVSV